MKRITILGNNMPSGTYLLRVFVKRDIAVHFGRFQGGRPISIPRGDLVYVGSAMAQRGSMTLARRLLRHATRRNRQNPQQIREKMLAAFKEAGMGPPSLKPPVSKSLFWNIDYLLEAGDVNLSHIIVIRSGTRNEDELAHFIERQPGTALLAKGLGAHDRPNDTHVFKIRESADWWQRLPDLISQYLDHGEL